MTAGAFHTVVGDLNDPPFGPIVNVYGPGGESLAYADSRPIAFTAPEAGIYMVVVEDNWTFSDPTESYNLYYAKALRANEGGLPVNGDYVAETIDLGDIGSHTFELFAGQAATLITTELSDKPFGPRMSVYGPAGAYLSGTTVNSLFITAVESGSHTVFVQDMQSFAARTGEYGLQLTTNAFCTPEQTADLRAAEAEAVPMMEGWSAALTAVPPANMPSAERYVACFGEPTDERVMFVVEGFTQMLETVRSGVEYVCKPVRFADDPSTPEVAPVADPSESAQVTKDEPGRIFIYDNFFRSPTSPPVSRAGILVHEFAHWNYAPAAVDIYEYKNAVYPGLPDFPSMSDYQTHASMVVLANPELAIRTADAYEFFTENTPALPMTAQTPCCRPVDPAPRAAPQGSIGDDETAPLVDLGSGPVTVNTEGRSGGGGSGWLILAVHFGMIADRRCRPRPAVGCRNGKGSFLPDSRLGRGDAARRRAHEGAVGITLRGEEGRCAGVDRGKKVGRIGLTDVALCSRHRAERAVRARRPRGAVVGASGTSPTSGDNLATLERGVDAVGTTPVLCFARERFRENGDSR